MKILLAVDGSAESQRAIASVATRAFPDGSVVRVLSVWQAAYPFSSPEAAGAVLLEQMAIELEAEAARAVQDATKQLQASRLVVEGKVRQGDPRGEIVEEASEWAADLIVLGSHGRTGVGRWLLGSVAEYVVRHARCSVEVARIAPPAQPGWGAHGREVRQASAPPR